MHIIHSVAVDTVGKGTSVELGTETTAEVKIENTISFSETPTSMAGNSL